MPDPTPLATPIETRPTPEVLDTLFYEFIDPESEGYVRLPVGSDYEQTGKYPGFKLVKEVRLEYNRAQRWYSNGQVNQDTWNYSIEYSGDGAGYDIFARRYLYRRDQYAELSRGTTFSGVYLAKVTAGGENYDEPPDIVASGGGGTGATFRAIINQNGELAWVLIVTEGTGFTSAPTLSVTGGGGTGGAVTAIIQPSDCVLVSEKVSELAQDDPRYSLFVGVVRIYETLPGPWIPFTRYDIFLGPIQGRRRAVLTDATQKAGLTATTKTTYEGRDGSSIVSWEIEETNTTGAGTAENPVFPPKVDDYYDKERGAVQRTTVVVNSQPGDVGGQSVAGGVVTEISYEAISEFLAKKITETWAVPVTRTDKEAVTVHGGGVATTIRETSGAQSAPTGGLMIIEDKSTDLGGGLFQNKLTTVAGSEWPPLTGTHVDEATGITVDFVKQVVAAGTTGGVSGVTFTEIQPHDKWLSISIASVLDLASLPADKTFPITVRHSFLDTLTSAQFVIEVSGDGNSVDIALLKTIKEGYSGPCNGTLTEMYMSAATFAAWTPPNITQFFPESVSINGVYTSGTVAKIMTFTIPPTLHASIDTSGASVPGSVIAATTPSALPADGTLILTDIQPEKWRFSVYKVSLVKVEVQSQT